MLVSQKIFTLLNERGMSQKEFAERTDISQSTISDWKRKKTNPSADKILKIGEVLQITPYELLSENEISKLENTIDYRIALNNEEVFLLKSFRGLDVRQKNRLFGYLEALKDKCD